MINSAEVLETNKMILEENLGVRTITMGVSLLDCADQSLRTTCANVEAKLMRLAKDLVKTGDEIGREFGVPIVNKRLAVTPIALVGAACCRRLLLPKVSSCMALSARKARMVPITRKTANPKNISTD